VRSSSSSKQSDCTRLGRGIVAGHLKEVLRDIESPCLKLVPHMQGASIVNSADVVLQIA